MFLSIPEGVSVMTVIIDGVDVAPAGLVKRSSGTREPKGRPLGITTQLRLKWLNNPGGKPQTPCDPGLCKIFPEAKTAAKAWAQGLRQPPDHHDRHFCECLRPRNPSLLSHYPGNGITVFIPGEAVPDAD